MENIERKKFSLKARAKSFVYAFKGIGIFISTQHNAWIHTFATILVVIGGFYFKISIAEWLFVILAIGLVMSAEIFNTAGEFLVDHVSPEYNKQAGIIKDLLAGGVLICAFTATIIGALIFLPKILDLL